MTREELRQAAAAHAAEFWPKSPLALQVLMRFADAVGDKLAASAAQANKVPIVSDANGKCCGELGPRGSWCTRMPGHTGEHIAATCDTVCERWLDEPAVDECGECRRAWEFASAEYAAGGSPSSPPIRCTHRRRFAPCSG
jgi:hypothetical protein